MKLLQRIWPPTDAALSIIGALIFWIGYPALVGAGVWWYADRHAVLREREMAMHQQAGEYYIDPNTFEKKFRYHWPIAAPTPAPRLEAFIPPFDPQL